MRMRLEQKPLARGYGPLSRGILAAALSLSATACGGTHAPSHAPPTLVVPVASASEPEEKEPERIERRDTSRYTPSGLRIEILRAGNGARAAAKSRVRFDYVGTLPDGSVFDSTRERGTPFEVELDRGYLIRGFEEGLLGMQVGEVRRLTIPPDLAYGDGSVGKIPPGSTLVFEIELLDVF